MYHGRSRIREQDKIIADLRRSIGGTQQRENPEGCGPCSKDAEAEKIRTYG